jgi:hypothetical protein
MRQRLPFRAACLGDVLPVGLRRRIVSVLLRITDIEFGATALQICLLQRPYGMVAQRRPIVMAKAAKPSSCPYRRTKK